jgi:hypothetical protein
MRSGLQPLQHAGVVMEPCGYRIGDISVVVAGTDRMRPRGAFGPGHDAAVHLDAEEAQGGLRPAGAPVLECDTWAVFRQPRGGLSFLSHLPYLSQRELARIDLDPDGRSGRLLYRADLPGDPLEYPLDQLLAIDLLSRWGGLLLHAAAVMVDGRVAIVAGPSGEGKTTFARAASRLQGAAILTDERVVLRPRGDRWWAYGTEWVGEGNFANPASGPVAGIYLLDKSDRDAAMPLSPVRALAGLVRAHFPASWAGNAATQIADLERLAVATPCYRLQTALGGRAPDLVCSSLRELTC